jgi:hypothetical protein
LTIRKKVQLFFVSFTHAMRRNLPRTGGCEDTEATYDLNRFSYIGAKDGREFRPLPSPSRPGARA